MTQNIIIDLQDGFSKDAVIVKVNGKTVFSEYNVTTKMLLGITGGQLYWILIFYILELLSFSKKCCLVRLHLSS
jgi:hypothetical protein